MNVNLYQAKPNQTIEEHVQCLMKVLQLLKEYGYIQDEKLYFLVEKACEHHDDGKVNPQFQLRAKSKKKIKFNQEKEIPHNILSGFLLNPEEFETEEDFYRILFAIVYHHDYGNPYEIMQEKQDLIRELLSEFKIFPINRRKMNIMQRMMYDDLAIKVKGFLHKCDYSASGNYLAEYPNEFLQDALEHVKTKWKCENPDSDWNEMQRFCMEKRDKNIIVVAQTGMGKTEAGFQWIGNHKGYFVLPLRTAINAIYDRVKKNILCDEKIDTRLSILHSESLAYYSRHLEENDMDLLEYENRGKRFSIPLNISTMDQLFDFVFKYQGYELKLSIFSYSKIVIDEIQMYDPELLAYLIYGLKRIVQMGGKVAIMTATLSPFMKELLMREIDFQEENVCTFTNNMIRHYIKTKEEKINKKDILELYEKNSKNGKSNKILVICNTIRKAQQLYTELKDEMSDSEKINLLHSRFTRAERAEKEKMILEFGRTFDQLGNIDKQEGIWISTSLVEASLDIDFDYLFTELQDLNSLMQRLGRCNRKAKKNVDEANCYVYLEIDHSILSSNGGFVDDTVYNISRQAMESIDGKLSEKAKIELLNNYLTMENLKESQYYRGEKGYKQTLKWIEVIVPYQYEKNEKRLRNILSQDIIPSPVYEKNKTDIQYALDILWNEKTEVLEKIRAKEEIMKYAVNISYWQWLEYQAAVKKDIAESYPQIKLGHYEEIPVMECVYGELGYEKMQYDCVVRETKFI